MTFWSLFCGIEGFGLGLSRAGFRCAGQVERDRDCNRVLQHHYPHTERLADVRQLRAILEPRNRKHGLDLPFVRPDLICGGFPCQDLSVAGRRAGLAGARSGLWWEFRRIIGLVRPSWVLIENVHGLLSSNRGRDMGAILWSLGAMGYGWAYRVLDSQWFGLAQRRKRVFIVGRSGGRFRSAAQVLFERECLPWDSAPSRTQRADIAAAITGGAGRVGSRGADDGANIVNALDAHMGMGGVDDNAAQGGHLVSHALTGKGGRFDPNGESYVAHTLRADGFDASEDGTGRGTPLVASTLRSRQHSPGQSMPGRGGEDDQNLVYQCQGGSVGPMGALRRGNGNEAGDVPFVAFSGRSRGAEPSVGREERPPLTMNGMVGALDTVKPWNVVQSGVRRLTPRECERLQGFPDDWTRWDADGNEISDSARYRMIGNAVSVPVIEWIARRMRVLVG